MTVSRRVVLAGMGAGVAATVAGCTETLRPDLGPPGSTAPSQTVQSPQSPQSPQSAPEVLADVERPASSWSQLRKSLDGKLVLPADSGYTAAKRAFNPAFDSRQPAAIAQVASASDVQKCIEHARSSDIPIAARSGGHSYPGNSTPSRGLIVDLGRLRGVSVRDDGTAVIGAGAKLSDVYAKLAAAGRCLPGGSCPTVGIGGLTLGGGVGVLTRKYGLTCDRLVSAKVVTADGTYRTVSASTYADLFWALRGGGGGNFGVVTYFTFRTAAAPKPTVFSLRFPAGSAAAVLGAWQDWIADAPDDLWSNLVVTGSSGSPTCRVGGCYTGGTGSLNPLLDRLVRAVGVQPTSRAVTPKSYLDAMRYFAGSGPSRERFAASSRMLVKPLSNPSSLVNQVKGRPGMDLLVDSLGGAVANRKVSETAFPHRTSLATVQIYATSTASSSRTSDVRSVRDKLGSVLGKRGYVNYLDSSMPAWGKAYYGNNVARLHEVGKRYDPDRVFDFAQNVARA